MARAMKSKIEPKKTLNECTDVDFNEIITNLKRALMSGDYKRNCINLAIDSVCKQWAIRPAKQNILCFLKRGFCECGREVIETNSFCPYCGKALDWTPIIEDEIIEDWD